MVVITLRLKFTSAKIMHTANFTGINNDFYHKSMDGWMDIHCVCVCVCVCVLILSFWRNL